MPKHILTGVYGALGNSNSVPICPIMLDNTLEV